MARFVFQLQSVLRHRERIEEGRQRELAFVVSELVRLERERQSLIFDMEENAAEVRNHHMTGKLDMAYLAAHRRYMLGMQRQLGAMAPKIAQQQKVVNEARAALAEASKQKKILEKLREKQHDCWSADQERREAGALDELNTQLSFRELSEVQE
jgi:flagellar FliJ protein